MALDHLYPQLKPLLKEDEGLTRSELDLNFPQVNGLVESKILKEVGFVEPDGRGRPPKLYLLTKKGIKAVQSAANGKPAKRGKAKSAKGKVGRPKGSTNKAKATVKRGRPKGSGKKVGTTKAKAKKGGVKKLRIKSR